MASKAGKTGEQRGNMWRIAGWSIPVMLLITPLVAMQYTDEVDWSVGDFIVMGFLFGLVGLGIELAVRRSGSVAFRIGAGVAIVTAFLLIWVNLAVGYLGDEDNPANAMFLGVLAIAFAGSALGRFRPAAMARAMLAAAAAQVLVGLAALAAGWTSPGAAGVYEVVLGSCLFGTLWLLSAGLLYRASR